MRKAQRGSRHNALHQNFVNEQKPAGHSLFGGASGFWGPKFLGAFQISIQYLPFVIARLLMRSWFTTTVATVLMPVWGFLMVCSVPLVALDAQAAMRTSGLLASR
jgi:hypothetical protein